MNKLIFKITIGFSALMFLKLTHNMKSFFLTAFLFLLTAAVYSQQNLSLRVVDSQTGEPLANASIKNTTTNQSYLTDKMEPLQRLKMKPLKFLFQAMPTKRL